MVRQAHHERFLAYLFSSFVVPIIGMIDCYEKCGKRIDTLTLSLPWREGVRGRGNSPSPFGKLRAGSNLSLQGRGIYVEIL